MHLTNVESRYTNVLLSMALRVHWATSSMGHCDLGDILSGLVL